MENMNNGTQQATANSTVNQKGNPNLKPCRHCGTMMAKSAKVCPSCGGSNKPPIYKRPWFIIIAVIFVLGIIGSNGTSSSSSSSSKTSTVEIEDTTEENVEVSEDTEVKEEKKEVKEEKKESKKSYKKVSCKTLMDDLDSNALKAEKKYKGQYVAIQGKLDTIDSSGKYISITPADDEWAIIGVHCSIMNEEQKDAVMDMNKGDVIVVKGQITDVGEVLGYYLDIDSFGE